MRTFGKYLRWNILSGLFEKQTVFFMVVCQISRCVSQTKKLRNKEVLNLNFRRGAKISGKLDHFEIHIWHAAVRKTVFHQKAPNEIF